MSRKNTARTAARTAPSARKKAVTSRRTTEAVEAAPALVEALPTTPAEAIATVVAEPVVAEPVVAEPAPAPAPEPVRIARAEFEAVVRREAWLLAEARSFRNGSAFEDWIRAERAVRARLAADGVSVR